MTRKAFLSALLVSTALVFAAAPALAQGGGCLSPQEANAAKNSGQILPLPEVLRIAGISHDQVRDPVEVCDRGGTLYYIIPVDRGAQYENVVLNASTGTP